MADIAAGFQEAVVDIITSKAVLACREHGIREVLLGGGVAANSRLRELLAARLRQSGRDYASRAASKLLCTDNGAMVAALGAQLVSAGVKPTGSALPRIPRCRSRPSPPEATA